MQRSKSTVSYRAERDSRIQRCESFAWNDASNSHNGMRVSRIRRCESFAWNAASSSHKASLNPTLSFPPCQRATIWNPGLVFGGECFFQSFYASLPTARLKRTANLSACASITSALSLYASSCSAGTFMLFAVSFSQSWKAL